MSKTKEVIVNLTRNVVSQNTWRVSITPAPENLEVRTATFEVDTLGVVEHKGANHYIRLAGITPAAYDAANKGRNFTSTLRYLLRFNGHAHLEIDNVFEMPNIDVSCLLTDARVILRDGARVFVDGEQQQGLNHRTLFLRGQQLYMGKNSRLMLDNKTKFDTRKAGKQLAIIDIREGATVAKDSIQNLGNGYSKLIVHSGAYAHNPRIKRDATVVYDSPETPVDDDTVNLMQALRRT